MLRVLQPKFLQVGSLAEHIVFSLDKGKHTLELYSHLSSTAMGCSSSTAKGNINGTNGKIKETTFGKITMCTEKDEDEYVEDVVCKNSDVQENEMKVFDLQDAGKVLLIRQKGKLSALGSKCTHYGAPLQSSVLGDGRIRCQWHGACFNIETGDIEDFPGLDSLPCYQITLEGENVKVRAKRSELESNKRSKPTVRRDLNNNQHFIVIGGGPSSAVCVETLRQEGFRGKITLVARENYLPYDRIKVDKDMEAKMEKIQLRQPEDYTKLDIEVLKGCEAVGVDTDLNTVKLKDGRTLNFDALYIATGVDARRADIPGANLENILVLRDYDHAVYTQSILAPNKHLVVLGGSFIGMEAAAYCSNKVEKVTVIIRDDLPFKESLGPEIGASVMEMYKSKGVEFVINSGIANIIDNGHGAVGSVELLDGTVLKADICIMGIGSIVNSDFIKDSGIKINSNGSIEVDEYLQTSHSNIYAGGDVAHAPVWSRDNIKACIGHYGLAHYHGKIAALNMLSKKQQLKAVPYFWTMLFGKGIRYAGYGKYDDIIIAGDVPQLKFVAFYLKDSEVVAVSSCQMDPIVSKYAELLAQGKKLYRDDLKDDPLRWSTL